MRIKNLISSLSLLVALAGGIRAQGSMAPVRCAASNQLVLKGLSKDNILAQAIVQNEVGPGLDQPWMLNMKSFGVKHAAAAVKFRFTSNQVDMSIEKVDLLPSYYDASGGFKDLSGITERDKQNFLGVLEIPFFREALRILQAVKATSDSCGTVYVNLLDDSCLPVRSEIPSVTKKCEVVSR